MTSMIRSIERKLAHSVNVLPIRKEHQQWMKRIDVESRFDTMMRGERNRHLHTYVHKNWKAAQKLKLIRDHNEFMLLYLNRQAFEQIYNGWGLVIATFAEKYSLKFERGRYRKEGEQGLYIRNANGKIVFGLTFVMSPHDSVLYIGSLQGGKHADAMEDIKALHRVCHGLRPIGILMAALYGVQEVFALRTMYGMPSKYANNARHGHKIKLDYDAYWAEHGGVREQYWYRLPLTPPVKDLSEVKSKHRSAYRRKSALLEQIRSDTVDTLRTAACSVPSVMPYDSEPLLTSQAL